MPKILIIEDEEIIINLLQRRLEKEGYEVLVARDRKEGLGRLRKSGQI